MPQHGNPVVSRSQNQRSAFMASFAQSLHVATVCLHCLTFVSALNTQIHNNFGGTTLNIVRILQMLLINVMGGFIQLSSHTFMSLDKSHNRTAPIMALGLDCFSLLTQNSMLVLTLT